MEGFDFAMKTHKKIGHFKTIDALKLHIHETTFWPGMDKDCREVVLECPECKHFGPAYHNALLHPIRRSRPFSLLCGDYLSLPKGRGGYNKVGLFVDVYSGFVWGYKLKTEPTAKCTNDCLEPIVDKLITPDMFMADGGTHFRGNEVKDFCAAWGIKHMTTPAYAPWNNGLVEGLNQLLLGHLRRLCSPDMDDTIDTNTPYTAENLPHSWPLHFDEAIRQLNDRIRTEMKRTPRELLFGLSLTPEHLQKHTPITALTHTTPETVEENEALADMVRMGAHVLQLEEAERVKAAWDARTPAVDFAVGDLVQWYDSIRDENKKTVNKLAPRWSTAHIISGKSLNSYTLSKVNGTAIPGNFASFRLRKFIPLRGSALALSAPSPTTPATDIEPNDANVDELEDRMWDGILPPFDE